MHYVVKQSAGGDKYDFFEGSKSIGSIIPLSNNEALLKMVGKGKVVLNLPKDFFEKVSEGIIPAGYLDEIIADGFSACTCEICPKPVSVCGYKKAE